MDYFDIALSLLTLTILEIVLGIDNIVFISIIANRVKSQNQKKARSLGLLGALVSRILLLFGIQWLTNLTQAVFTIAGEGFSWRDIILFSGGIFLLAKSVSEIHHKVEGEDEDGGEAEPPMSMAAAVTQIVLIDMVFSFDSILTAVGLTDQIYIMITAVTIAMAVMFFFATAISDFVNSHPTVKVLALSFLLMIGMLLIVEAFHVHVPKGYVYFAMAFSLGVELLNMRMRSKGMTLKQSLKHKEQKKKKKSSTSSSNAS